MATKEELLAERTFNQDGLDVEQRVFFSLMGDINVTQETTPASRNSKAISLICKRLLDAHILTPDQLDEILLAITW